MIQAKAHHEIIGNVQGNIFHGHRSLVRVRFEKQCSHCDRSRMMLRQCSHHMLKRMSGINNILENDHIAALYLFIQAEIDAILSRVRDVDPGEADEVQEELEVAIAEWKQLLPSEYGRMGGKPTTTTLAYPYGSSPDPVFQDKWSTHWRDLQQSRRASRSSRQTRPRVNED